MTQAGTGHLHATRRSPARGAALLVLFASASVQADSAEVIARCAELDAPAARIACLEQALERTDEPGAAVALQAPLGGNGPSGADPRAGEARRVASEPRGTAPPPARDAAEPLPAASSPQSEAPEAIRVTVVAIEESGYGRRRYVTADGQIWEQTDQRTPRYPDLPFAADVRGAAAGSFFLKPRDSGVAVRVQRRR